MSQIYIERSAKIATILFNRPGKKNSFTLAMFQELGRILDELKGDSTIKVGIVKGIDETAFSSGADISEFLDVRFATEHAKAYNDAALEAIEKLYHFPRPTIAIIKKLAIGGGLELANACDFRFVTKGSKLGITAANIGIVYNLTSTKRLINLVGIPKAKELLYTAKLITAEEGKKCGLISEVYSYKEIDDACDRFVQQLLTKSPVANAGIKQVIHSIIDGDIEESDEIAKMILHSYSSDDYKEGIQAFLDKRKPNFK